MQAWLIAGLFVLLAVPVTIYEVAMHLEYFSRPRLQIYVIRILWMVPIYAVDAWLALRFKVTPITSLIPPPLQFIFAPPPAPHTHADICMLPQRRGAYFLSCVCCTRSTQLKIGTYSWRGVSEQSL